MPKRAKKQAEAEAAEMQSTENRVVAAEARAEAEAEERPKKTPRKKRARQAESASSAPVAMTAAEVVPPVAQASPAASEIGQAELAAEAADTFDEAYDSKAQHDKRSELAAESAPQPENKKAPTKRSSRKKRELEPKVQPEPRAGEADELEGDWESAGGERPGPMEHGPGGQETGVAPKLERLQKILSRAGIASRRHAEEMIADGRVQVNGNIVTALGSKADPARDHIRVDGKLLHGAERLRYFVLNKPRGYVTTVSDPEGRPTVMEFFTKFGERLYPVGRLDYQSEGLLLMTNDGELANQLTRAASGVEKTYLVKVSGQPDEDLIDALREGLRIDRGRPGEGRVRTAPARIQQVRQGENPWFEVGLIEGRNRELRKMFEEIGHHVEKIRRVGYGPLVLDLEPGKMRELEAEEVRLLRLAAEGKWKSKRVKASAMLPSEAGKRQGTGERGNQGPGRRRPEDRRPRPGRRDRDFAGGQGRRGEQQRFQASGRQGDDRQREQSAYGDRPQRRGYGENRERDRRREGAGREGRVDFGGQRQGAAGGPGRGFEGDRGRRGGAGSTRSGAAPGRGQRPFRARPEQGERPQFERGAFKGRPNREFEGPPPRREGFQDRSSDRGSDRGGGRGARPPRGGFRPERAFGERGGEQRRGQAGGFRQRPGPGGDRESGLGAGQGRGQEFGERSSGRPGTGPRREGNRGGFAGRRSGPPKFGGRGRSGGGRGGRRP